MPDRLGGIFAKISRAHEHLEALRRTVAECEHASCKVVIEKDPESDIGWLSLSLPKPPRYISVLAGDCLYNLRSTLDHLVWQLVLANPPQRPHNRNMFPICTSSGAFDEQIKKGRLDGVAEPAIALIKGLQPGNARDHPLFILGKLHNIDKHQALNLVMAVASDLDLVWTQNGQIRARTIMSSQDLNDGTRFLGFSLSDPRFSRMGQVEVYGDATTFVAFEDIVGADDGYTPIQSTLESIREFITESVIEPLEPFLN
jgi:hypothetical protein